MRLEDLNPKEYRPTNFFNPKELSKGAGTSAFLIQFHQIELGPPVKKNKQKQLQTEFCVGVLDDYRIDKEIPQLTGSKFRFIIDLEEEHIYKLKLLTGSGIDIYKQPLVIVFTRAKKQKEWYINFYDFYTEEDYRILEGKEPLKPNNPPVIIQQETPTKKELNMDTVIEEVSEMNITDKIWNIADKVSAYVNSKGGNLDCFKFTGDCSSTKNKRNVISQMLYAFGKKADRNVNYAEDKPVNFAGFFEREDKHGRMRQCYFYLIEDYNNANPETINENTEISLAELVSLFEFAYKELKNDAVIVKPKIIL